MDNQDPFADLTQAQGSEGDPFADLTPQSPNNTTAGPFWSSKTGRFLQGAAEPAVGLAQLAAHATGYGKETMDDVAKREDEFYKASRKEAGLTDKDWDYFAGAGNVLSPVNLAPGAAIGRVAGAGTTLLGMAGRGAAAGAAYGATQPVADASDYGGAKASQVASGAVTGGIAGPATGLAAKVISPNASKTAAQLAAEGVSPEEIRRIGQLQLLDREGVPLTGPQILGGTAERLENALETTPFIGTPIRAAKQRGYEGFNIAAGNRALRPINEEVPRGVAPGHDLFNYVEDRLGTRFDDLHSRMSATVDHQFGSDAHQIMQDAMVLPPAQQAQLQAMVDNQILHKFTANAGTIDGRTIQSIGSELKAFVRARRADPSADTRALAGHVDDLRDAFEAMLQRQNPAEAGPLRDANLGWAHLVRLEKATANTAAGAHGGIYSGSQLLSAEGQSAGKRGMARGNGLYQDIAEAAKSILPAKMPSSGTAERAATLGLIGGGLTISPQAALAAATLPALYSRTGQRITQAALMRRQAGANFVADLMRQYGPTTSTRAALALASQTANQGQ